MEAPLSLRALFELSFGFWACLIISSIFRVKEYVHQQTNRRTNPHIEMQRRTFRYFWGYFAIDSARPTDKASDKDLRSEFCLKNTKHFRT